MVFESAAGIAWLLSIVESSGGFVNVVRLGVAARNIDGDKGRRDISAPVYSSDTALKS